MHQFPGEIIFQICLNLEPKDLINVCLSGFSDIRKDIYFARKYMQFRNLSFDEVFYLYINGFEILEDEILKIICENLEYKGEEDNMIDFVVSNGIFELVDEAEISFVERLYEKFTLAETQQKINEAWNKLLLSDKLLEPVHIPFFINKGVDPSDILILIVEEGYGDYVVDSVEKLLEVTTFNDVVPVKLSIINYEIDDIGDLRALDCLVSNGIFDVFEYEARDDVEEIIDIINEINNGACLDVISDDVGYSSMPHSTIDYLVAKINSI